MTKPLSLFTQAKTDQPQFCFTIPIHNQQKRLWELIKQSLTQIFLLLLQIIL